MEMKEALGLCLGKWKVRPVCWRLTNPDHWIEHRTFGNQFVEVGDREEMVHRLRLATYEEFLGEWEVVE